MQALVDGRAVLGFGDHIYCVGSRIDYRRADDADIRGKIKRTTDVHIVNPGFAARQQTLRPIGLARCSVCVKSIDRVMYRGRDQHVMSPTANGYVSYPQRLRVRGTTKGGAKHLPK